MAQNSIPGPLVFQYGPDVSADCEAAARRWREFAEGKLRWASYEEERGDIATGAVARRMAAQAMETAAGLDARARVAAAEGR